MSDRLENGEARLASYIKRAKKTDGLEFPVDVSDWRNAQVIEATVDGQRLFLTKRRSDLTYTDYDGSMLYPWSSQDDEHAHDDLSDVRVIVDAEGKVAPPPITDEMVRPIAEALYHAVMVETRDEWPLFQFLPDASRRRWIDDARAALTAALGGADHG